MLASSVADSPDAPEYEDVLGCGDVGYAGIWTNFNGTDSWRNMGLRVINVYRFAARGQIEDAVRRIYAEYPEILRALGL